MLYPVVLFVLSGLLGTVIALRLMAIDAQEKKSRLTRRGRIVVGIAIGLLIALIVVLFNGMWWDCDLRAGSNTACRLYWGY